MECDKLTPERDANTATPPAQESGSNAGLLSTQDPPSQNGDKDRSSKPEAGPSIDRSATQVSSSQNGYEDKSSKPEASPNTDPSSAQGSSSQSGDPGKSSTSEVGSNIDPPTAQVSSSQNGDEDKSSTSEVDSNIDTSSAQVSLESKSPAIDNLIQKWSKDPPVLIAVMGCTGSGKTTFVNNVSGSLLKIGHELDSCTFETQVSEEFELDGKRVVLIDTPGFDDTSREGVDILRSIAKPLGKMYSAGVKLNGVIYVHRISDDKFGGSAVSNFRIFKKLCGKDALKNVVLMTTMWGRVTPARGEDREQQLKDNYFGSALAKGAKLLRYGDTLESAHEILRKILENKPVVLRIQTELIDKRRKDVGRTAAGMVVNREIRAALKKSEKEIKVVKKSMKKAAKGHDEESRQELEEEKKRIREEVEQLKEALPNQPSKVERTKETLASFVPVLRAKKPPSDPVETPAGGPTDSAERGEGGDVKQDAKEEHQKEIKVVKKSMKKLAKGNDEESRQQLEEEKKRMGEEVEQLKEALPNQPSKVERTKETVTSFVSGLRAKKPPRNPVETPAVKPTESAGQGEGGDVNEGPAETASSQSNGTSTDIAQEPPTHQPSAQEDGFEDVSPGGTSPPPVAGNGSKGSGELQSAGSKHSPDKAPGKFQTFMKSGGKGFKSRSNKSTP